MRLFQYLVLLIIPFLYASATFAFSIEQYDAMKEKGPQSLDYRAIRVYIEGMKDGLELAHASLEAEGKPVLFCAPREEQMNTEGYLQVINEALSQRRKLYTDLGAPLGVILLVELTKYKYPCSQRK